MPKVAIVGGGITGLSAAYALEKETDFEVTLIESSTALGGKIQTSQDSGFTIEAGPDSIFVGKPGAVELIEQLGLQDEVIEPAASGFHLLVGSKLHAVPPGLASLAGVSPQVIDKASFLSAEGKKRALDERSIPAGDGKDESIQDFFTRRFGAEFCRLVAEPILAGTHGGDPSKLSMKALYPMYLQRELKDGNLSTPSSASPSSKGPMFLSFRGGMATLSHALERSLQKATICLAQSILRFESVGDQTKIWTEEYPYQHVVDHVLLTVPSSAAATLLWDFPTTADLLSRIRFASSSILTCAYSADSLSKELCGTGFLTPFDESQGLTGCTWSSRKWPHRSPDDMLLVRYFFGGDGRPQASNREMEQTARQVAKDVLGINGEPLLKQVFDWNGGLPQYDLGHTELVDQIEHDLQGSPYSVAGASYRGVGIPDCIRQGREAARKIAGALS